LKVQLAGKLASKPYRAIAIKSVGNASLSITQIGKSFNQVGGKFTKRLNEEAGQLTPGF